MDRQAGLESGNPLNLILFTPSSFFISIFAFRSIICHYESHNWGSQFLVYLCQPSKKIQDRTNQNKI
jgi:hypothetical protein